MEEGNEAGNEGNEAETRCVDFRNQLALAAHLFLTEEKRIKPDDIKMDATQSQAPRLVRALQLADVARIVVPERAFMLRRASKSLREAVEAARPAVEIRVKRGTLAAQMEEGLIDLQQWCLVKTFRLPPGHIGAEGAARLAAVLGQCPSLARLDFGGNLIALPPPFYLYLHPT